MRAELRDALVERITERAQELSGGLEFDVAIAKALRLFELVVEHLALMRSKDELRNLLGSMPDPSFTEQKLMMAVIKYTPSIVRFLLKHVADVASDELPAPPGGRPSIDVHSRAKIVALVGKLHMESYSFPLAKREAAERFGISVSTVQRIWDDRRSLEDADFRSALDWLINAKD